VISMGMAMSLVPVISDAFERKDYGFLKLNVETGIRVAMLIGLPCAFGIMALSEQIMLLLYPMQKASAISAAASLSILGLGLVFLTLVQTLTGILQGLGKPSIPVKNLFIGGLFKIAATYILTGIASINIKGAAFGTLLAYMIATLLNIRAVIKYTHAKINVKLTVIKPVIAVGIMTIAVIGSFKLFNNIVSYNLSTALAICTGAAVYGIALIAVKGITYEDFSMLPRGKKLAQLLVKMKLMKK
ncbi:MAG: polysaccharide biosynthesis C-terminal domain-containing protein, partial [Clostridia bacterium]|nr:polysaccharide biosynthesis C-terminal domain-containing protein [Clostridia bacterium]